MSYIHRESFNSVDILVEEQRKHKGFMGTPAARFAGLESNFDPFFTLVHFLTRHYISDKFSSDILC